MSTRGRVLLSTLVMAPNGCFTELGKFLHRPDWPWREAVDHDGQSATIRGATLERVEEYRDAVAMSIVVSGREKAPIVCHPETKLYVVHEDPALTGWTLAQGLKVGDRIRVPELGNGRVVVAWSSIRSVRRSEGPQAIFAGTPAVWGYLMLERGHWGWMSPGGAIHC